MKESKLNLEKFRVAKLINPSMIQGGNGDEGGTETEDGAKKKKKCILGSAIKVDAPK
jgi:hypothetical protein